METMKIGFFIKGLYQYEHLIKPLLSEELYQKTTIYIFHVSSMYDYKTEFTIDDRIILIDVKKNNNLFKLFTQTHPDWIVFFNPGQIFNVFATLVCKKIGIKTMYCQHGLSLEFGSFNIKKISQGKTSKDKIKSAKRYWFYYSTIFKNILFQGNGKGLLKHIIIRTKQLFHYGTASYPKYGLIESHCDKAIVFGQYDKRYLINKNGYNDQDIIIGGYPMNALDDKETLDEIPDNYILYISSGLRTSGVIPITDSEEKRYYNKLRNIIVGEDYNFVIKLHPTESDEQVKGYFADPDKTYVYRDKNLANLAYKAEAVIGDYSTALFYAIKYSKPILIMESEYFDQYPFDYTQYGIGFKTGIDKLKETLRNELKVETDAYNNFIDDYISNMEIGIKEIFIKTLKN